MAVGRKLREMHYRMKLRKTLTNASIEELKITKEELNKEIIRRNKK